jgi:hypothetical protein
VKGSVRGIICGKFLNFPGRTEACHEKYVRIAAFGPGMGVGGSSLRFLRLYLYLLTRVNMDWGRKR